MKSTLEKHGTKVINALGAMVSALKAEDDAALVAKVSEVSEDKIFINANVKCQYLVLTKLLFS